MRLPPPPPLILPPLPLSQLLIAVVAEIAVGMGVLLGRDVHSVGTGPMWVHVEGELPGGEDKPFEVKEEIGFPSMGVDSSTGSGEELCPAGTWVLQF